MDNRLRILEAAARVYGEVGFRGATTRRIAAEAGVNEVTLFRIFGSKGVLLAEAVRCCGPGRDDAVTLPAEPIDPERELMAWATGHLAHLHRNAPLIRTMLGEVEARPEVADTLCLGPRCAHARLRGYVTALRRAGLIDADVAPQAAAAMMLGTLFGDAMGRSMMPDVYPQPESTAVRHYVRMFLRALGVSPSSARASPSGSTARRGPARAPKRLAVPVESRRRKQS